MAFRKTIPFEETVCGQMKECGDKYFLGKELD